MLGAAILLLVSGFVAGRILVDSSAQADDPLTQDAGVEGKRTPDWFAPLLEEEQAAQRFRGTINGLELGASDGPLPDCAAADIRSDTSLLRGTDFDLGLDALPAGVRLQAAPRIGVCRDDGRVIWIIVQLEVLAGPAVNGEVGLIQVSRWENVRWYRQTFLADRVTPRTIAGRPAVFAGRGDSGFGEAAVIVLDEEIHGSTMLISTNVELDYMASLADEIYR
jgi:hypothetical protein